MNSLYQFHARNVPAKKTAQPQKQWVIEPVSNQPLTGMQILTYGTGQDGNLYLSSENRIYRQEANGDFTKVYESSLVSGSGGTRNYFKTCCIAFDGKLFFIGIEVVYLDDDGQWKVFMPYVLTSADYTPTATGSIYRWGRLYLSLENNYSNLGGIVYVKADKNVTNLSTAYPDGMWYASGDPLVSTDDKILFFNEVGASLYVTQNGSLNSTNDRFIGTSTSTALGIFDGRLFLIGSGDVNIFNMSNGAVDLSSRVTAGGPSIGWRGSASAAAWVNQVICLAREEKLFRYANGAFEDITPESNTRYSVLPSAPNGKPLVYGYNTQSRTEWFASLQPDETLVKDIVLRGVSVGGFRQNGRRSAGEHPAILIDRLGRYLIISNQGLLYMHEETI